MQMIKVKTLDARPRVVFVPRMRFKFNMRSKSSYHMTRVQFPLRLCYAMSVNKSQGQSFERALLDATVPSFTHGHAYVAMSRIRMFSEIRLIVNSDHVFTYEDPDSTVPRTAPMIVNVVYPTVIQRPA